MRAILGVVAALALMGLSGCKVVDETQTSSGPVPEGSGQADTQLSRALGEFGSSNSELNAFLESGDPTLLQKVLRKSREKTTGYGDLSALRQITAFMAEKQASPERFMQFCLGTDLLVVDNYEYVYTYDQWHTAVCLRGAGAESTVKESPAEKQG